MIAIFGDGYIGNILFKRVRSCGLYNCCPSVNYQAVSSIVADKAIHLVVNCIAFTGGKKGTDGCDKDPVKTADSNITQALVLAKACHDARKPMIQLSTIAGNLNKYYMSKIFLGRIMRDFFKNVTTLRISHPYDYEHHERNLFNKVMRYKKVHDKHVPVTSIPQLVKYIGDFGKADIGKEIDMISGHVNLKQLRKSIQKKSFECDMLPYRNAQLNDIEVLFRAWLI